MHSKKNTNIKNGIMVMSSIMVCLVLCMGCENSGNLSAEQLIEKGRQYYSEGRIDDAVKFFKKALELRPEDGGLHYELGVMSYKECSASYDMAMQRVLKDVFRGRLKNKSDNDKEMIKHGYRKDLCELATLEFVSALKYDQSNWMARYFVASDLFKSKQYEQAVHEFKIVIKDKPDYPDSYGYLGRAYLEIGQYKDAKRMLEKANKMKSSDYKLYLLGLAYKGLKDWEKLDEIEKELKEKNSIYYNTLKESWNPSEHLVR